MEMNKAKRFAKFVIVGIINTANYYLIYLIFLKILKTNYLFSHITGFLAVFIISFFLNCYFVYHVKPTWQKFFAFPLTQVVNMGVQTLLLYLFVDIFSLNAEWAPFPALIFTIPVTYMITTYILTKESL
ncbi:GtrA family protein [Macrococcus equi]|uniref:GtrA family protein n=1 Tax=Macrococcus equi TaxID=3395462 RepID=UPI0039BDDEDD